MIAWKIFYAIGNSGKINKLPIRSNGGEDYEKTETICVTKETKTLTLIFDFFDPRDSKPLPEIMLDYSWDELAADPALNEKAKHVVLTTGEKGAAKYGRAILEFPLVEAPLVKIFFEAEVVHCGVGAYPDEFLALDISIKKE